MPPPFPLFVPFEARRLFQSESLVRRVAQMAHWDSKARLAELHGSLTGLALAKMLDCELTVVEPAGQQFDYLKDRARLAGINDLVHFEAAEPNALALPASRYEGILSLGRVTGLVTAEARRLRPSLAERGRVGLTVVMKVGREPNGAAVAAWEARLGAPLPSPRDALLSLETEGYEPELVETASEAELEEYYQSFEAALNKGPADGEAPAAREELALFRAHQGKSGVTFGFVVGRRKEPGEKPPMSRDSG